MGYDDIIYVSMMGFEKVLRRRRNKGLRIFNRIWYKEVEEEMRERAYIGLTNAYLVKSLMGDRIDYRRPPKLDVELLLNSAAATLTAKETRPHTTTRHPSQTSHDSPGQRPCIFAHVPQTRD